MVDYLNAAATAASALGIGGGQQQVSRGFNVTRTRMPTISSAEESITDLMTSLATGDLEALQSGQLVDPKLLESLTQYVTQQEQIASDLFQTNVSEASRKAIADTARTGFRSSLVGNLQGAYARSAMEPLANIAMQGLSTRTSLPFQAVTARATAMQPANQMMEHFTELRKFLAERVQNTGPGRYNAPGTYFNPEREVATAKGTLKGANKPVSGKFY